MKIMLLDKINFLARLLNSHNTIEFQYNNFYYEIFESVESGYIVNLYSNNIKDEDGNYFDKYIVDGGLCTGSAKEAIKFML